MWNNIRWLQGTTPLRSDHSLKTSHDYMLSIGQLCVCTCALSLSFTFFVCISLLFSVWKSSWHFTNMHICCAMCCSKCMSTFLRMCQSLCVSVCVSYPLTCLSVLFCVFVCVWHGPAFDELSVTLGRPLWPQACASVGACERVNFHDSDTSCFLNLY